MIFIATFTNVDDAQRAYEIAQREYPMFNPTIVGCVVTTSSDRFDPDEVTIDWGDRGLTEGINYEWRYG